MSGDVQNFDSMLGSIFPGITDIVAEVRDRSVTVRILKMLVESGLSLQATLPLGKSIKKIDQIIVEGSDLALLDKKSRMAYRTGLPLGVMIARFPGHHIHNFIRVNYSGLWGNGDKNKKMQFKDEIPEAEDIRIKALESQGWIVLYPSGSLLADQRLESRVKELAVNGRDSTMFREFTAFDEKNMVSSQIIELVDYSPDDERLWEQWLGNMDTNMFQTIVRPTNFTATKGRSEDYYLKLISYGSRKIGAVWVEKISQRTATAELGLLIGEPHLWGLGLGSKAINAMMSIARQDLGLNFLWVSVRESNQRAVNCYKRGGFTIVRKEPVYRSDGSYQMWVHMEKMI